MCRLFLYLSYLFICLLCLELGRLATTPYVLLKLFCTWPAACVEESMEILISRRPILNDWAWVPFSLIGNRNPVVKVHRRRLNVYFAGVERPAYKKGGKKAAEADRVHQSIWATVIFCLNTPSRCCTFCSSPIGSCICWPHRRLVNWHDAPFFCRGTMVL